MKNFWINVRTQIEIFLDYVLRFFDLIAFKLDQFFGLADRFFDIFRWLGILHDSSWRLRFSLGAKMLAEAGFSPVSENNQMGGYSLLASSQGQILDIFVRVHRYTGVVEVSSHLPLTRPQIARMKKYVTQRGYGFKYTFESVV